MSQPLVSIVTPFHNTAQFLEECIESVLRQSYDRFEYVLIDNCSTDGSGDIAARFAQKDSRIRFIRRTQLLSQVQNYNAALVEISPNSKYCKIVQADDSIFPDCIRLMVQAFEQSGSIDLVSSYYLKGNIVRGSGFPLSSNIVPGREMGRFYLQTGIFVFGSPTAVMYRSSIVREQAPFYDESLLHEDTEKCLQLLEHGDFAFVHQILSYLRVADESISGAARNFEPDALDWYIIAQRYATRFLDAQESSALLRDSRRSYYHVLAKAVVDRREAAFWKYHRDGLKTIHQAIDHGYLTLQVIIKMLWLLLNPGQLVQRAFAFLVPAHRTGRAGGIR